MDLAKEFPTDYIEGWHLFGKKDVVLTISGAKHGTLPNFRNGQDESKVLITFKESPKSLILNKTNLKTLVILLGSTDTDQWIGKRIALFSEWVKVGGQQKLGVRVRDFIPDSPKPTRREQKEATGPNEAPPMPEAQAVQSAMIPEPPPNHYQE